MDFISEGDLVTTALMVMLLGSWVVFATAPRYSYVSPVEYDPVDFNLNNWTPKHLRRTMRFTKREIIVYRSDSIIRLCFMTVVYFLLPFDLTVSHINEILHMAIDAFI